MTTTSEEASLKSRFYAGLQRFGRSLMLPIAPLPAAAILLRLGQDDMLGRWDATSGVADVLAAAGDSLFNWLPLLFAVGIAVGFARKGDGSTGLAAVVGFVVFNAVVQSFSPITEMEAFQGLDENAGWLKSPINWPYSVLSGVIVGLVTAVLWQRFHRIKLPQYLGFFGGRRFVPIINSVALMLLGVVFGLIFPYVDAGITNVGHWIMDAPLTGSAIYGVLNRLLIPVGLHQLLNVPIWFIFDGGEITNFFDGDPEAGLFLSGFFPIFMFALPAAALAIYRTAKPSQKKIVSGIMGSAALTAFVTGVTEPLEFAFMFVAWPLYVIHAVFTGLSMVVTNLLNIHMGFGFSAGAIDFLLNMTAPAANNAWMLIPIGLIFAVMYYFTFRWVILRWNMKTPGREDDATAAPADPTADPAPAAESSAETVTESPSDPEQPTQQEHVT